MPQRATGTTGTPICKAHINPPFLKGIISPFIDRVPSGYKMMDRGFFAMDFLAFSKDFIACLWLRRSTKKCPPAIMAHPKMGIRLSSILDMETI